MRISILAIYKLPFTDDMVQEEARARYAWEGLTQAGREEALSTIQEQFDSTVLVELKVEGYEPETFKADDLGQPTTDQAAWDERYLEIENDVVVAEGDRTADLPSSFRVLFFLHYFDPDAPLNTSCGPVPCPPVLPMPERLRELMPYGPP